MRIPTYEETAIQTRLLLVNISAGFDHVENKIITL